MAAKKKAAKKLYVFGPDGYEYVYDSTFTSIKSAEASAVERVLDGGEDDVTIYELVPVKTVKISVDVREVK